MTQDNTVPTKEYWIFGYGSLIYKPPPHFDRSVPGYITGHVRRFWQSSNDHRGTPEAPGRVVTLLTHEFWSSLTPPDSHRASEGTKVWGVAYRIDPVYADQARIDLDHREKNGYTVEEVEFYPSGKNLKNFKCEVYVGTPDNEAFVGNVETPEQLARRILQRRGPSGENREYLYKLHESLIELDTEAGDHHIEELVRLAKEIEKTEGL